MSKNPTYPTKRYRYDCKCGKDPLHGTLAASPTMERHLFNVLDLGWAESHNRPGCGLKSKTVELHNRKATTPWPMTEENRLSDELRRLTRAILKALPDAMPLFGMGGHDGYGVEIDTPVFAMHPHDENPICNCGAEDADVETPCAETCPYGWPNFKHKPSGFAVHWHKWIGRSMEVVGAPPDDLAAMIDECIASIPLAVTP